MITMQKFAFSVDIVATELDRDAIVQSLTAALNDSLPGDVHANVKAGEVKSFSEQGYKVWRARVTGVTADAAGDSANPKKSKKETVEA
jgi:phage head maturation protease